MTTGQTLQDLLGLKFPPVAITFRSAAPAGVARVAPTAPSSCSYWMQAAQGQTFYTEASDHYNCPIGAYTHGVELPAAQMQELQDVVGTMIKLGYLKGEEVPAIPRRPDPFRVAVYAPLDQAGSEADVVLVRGNARQIMMLQEAAQAAGVGNGASTMGRPTCAALPAAVLSQHGIASLGCIGNRVYTDMGDDELYYALPANHLADVAAKLADIVHANRELEKYHRQRRTSITPAHPSPASSGGAGWAARPRFREQSMQRYVGCCVLGIALTAAVPASAEIVKGVLFVRGAEMSWWGGMARDAIARQYDVETNSVILTPGPGKERYQAGTITFQAKLGKSIPLEKLRESIAATRLSGGTRMQMDYLEITVQGKVTANGANLVLRATDSDREFVLGEHADAKGVLARLRDAHTGDMKIASVTGHVQGWSGRFPDVLRAQAGSAQRRLLVKDFAVSQE